MSGTVLNVFDRDPFTSVTLTEAVVRNPYPPRGLGNLSLFKHDYLYTEGALIEQKKGQLMVLPMLQRGEPPTQLPGEADKREARFYKCPMIAHEAKVTALEVMGVRETGTIARMRGIQELLGDRLSGESGLLANLENTLEAHRLAAVQGMLLDALPPEAPLGTVPSVKYNWFDEFGVPQPAPIPFNFAALNGTPGALQVLCNDIVRKMNRASQGAFHYGTKIIGLCSDGFFDSLITSQDVRSTYLNWLAAETLRLGSAFAGDAKANPMLSEAFATPFPFASIFWINYRGSDDMTSIAVPPGSVQFFPINAPGVFKLPFAPHDNEQWVNKRAKPKYVIPVQDLQEQRWRKFIVYSYPLHICVRPEVLLSGFAG